MKPVIFTIGNIPFTAYGVLIALSITIGWYLCDWFFKKMRYNMLDINIGYPLTVMMSILGARVFYLLTIWDLFIEEPRMFLTVRSSGMVWYGGLIFGIICGVIYSSARRINVGDFADMTAVPLALGLALTRIGCFLNGCCFGKETRSFLGVQFPRDSFPNYHLHPGDPVPYLHPVQLYESLFCFALAGFCWYVLKRRHSRGTTFVLMTLLYALGRFFLEFFRGDTTRGIYGVLSTSQYISIGFVIVALPILFWLKKHCALPPDQYGVTPPR